MYVCIVFIQDNVANLRARKTPFLLLSKFNPPKIFIGIHMLLLSKHIMYERSEELPSFSISGEGLRWEFIKENKKVRKQENKNSTKKVIKKKRKFFSFFLGRFLGRVLVFFLVFLFSRFLTFLFSFINSHLCPCQVEHLTSKSGHRNQKIIQQTDLFTLQVLNCRFKGGRAFLK